MVIIEWIHYYTKEQDNSRFSISDRNLHTNILRFTGSFTEYCISTLRDEFDILGNALIRLTAGREEKNTTLTPCGGSQQLFYTTLAWLFYFRKSTTKLHVVGCRSKGQEESNATLLCYTSFLNYG